MKKMNTKETKTRIPLLRTFGSMVDLDKKNIIRQRSRSHRQFEHDMILSLHMDFIKLITNAHIDPELKHQLIGIVKAICLTANLAMLPDDARATIIDRNKQENRMIGIEE